MIVKFQTFGILVKPSWDSSRSHNFNGAAATDNSVTSAAASLHSPPLENNNSDQFLSHQRLSAQSLSHRKQILLDEDSTETVL